MRMAVDWVIKPLRDNKLPPSLLSDPAVGWFQLLLLIREAMGSDLCYIAGLGPGNRSVVKLPDSHFLPHPFPFTTH